MNIDCKVRVVCLCVATLSNTVEAGFLSTDTTGDAHATLHGVLERVHLLTTAQLAPGEDAIETVR